MGILKNLFPKDEPGKDKSSKKQEAACLQDVIESAKKDSNGKDKVDSRKVKSQVAGGLTGSDLELSENELQFVGTTPNLETQSASNSKEVNDSKANPKVEDSYAAVTSRYKPPLIKKKAKVLEIVICGASSDIEEISKIIAEKGDSQFIRVFSIEEGNIRVSDVLEYKSESFNKELLSFLSLKEADKSKEVNFDRLFSYIKMDALNLSFESSKYIYEVDGVKVIFYGYPNSFEDKFTDAIKQKFQAVLEKYETSFYMLSDDTIYLATLGFRNLYLIDRITFEGVK